MKKVFLLLLIMVISFNLSASLLQSDSIPQFTRQEYMRKSKIQLTGAIISLTGGVLLSGIGGFMLAAGAAEVTSNIIIGGILYPITGTEPTVESNKGLKSGSILLLIGVTAMIVSIPLFISHSKNKKRGLSITAGSQSIQQMNKSSISKTIIPSVGLTIRL